MKKNLTGYKQYRPLTLPLILLSALIWVGNITWRRLALTWGSILGAVSSRFRKLKQVGKKPGKTVSAVKKSYVSILRAQKKKRRDSGSAITSHAPEDENVDLQESDVRAGENKTQHPEVDDDFEQDINLAARLRKRLRDKKPDEESRG